jgi:hypothetical protein
MTQGLIGRGCVEAPSGLRPRLHTDGLEETRGRSRKVGRSV